MNRTFGFGVALFFAILSIAVLGNETEVAAGSGCAGDGGCAASACDGGGCHAGCWGRKRCHGRRWFKRRCHGGGGCHAVACNGAAHDCAASCAGGCHSRCHGGLFARWRARRAARCCGVPVDCCGQPVACHGGCAGDVIIEEAPAEPAPAEAPAEVPAAPAEESSADAGAAPKVVYRSVVYRR